jgi:tetratricopeptide (TPR) repeat protein
VTSAAELARGAAIEAQKGRHEAAATLYRRSLQLDPAAFRTLSNLGLSLRCLGRLEEAVTCFQQALALRPDYALAAYNQGIVLRELGRYAEALDAYDYAIGLQGRLPEALNNRADVLQDLQQYEMSVGGYDAALAIKPDYWAARCNRAIALFRLHDFERALADFDAVAAAEPRNAQAWSGRGHALQALRRYPEAVASYDRAIDIGPTVLQTHMDKGHALRQIRAFDAAQECFDQAVALDPGSAPAQLDAGLCRLLREDFERGFRQFEWRWRVDGATTPGRLLGKDPWLGQTSLQGKRIFVYAELGHGDALHMARYATLLADLGATVIMEVPAVLTRIIADVPGVSGVIAAGDAVPQFDEHCPLLSLPLALGTRSESIPRPASYLRADPRRIAEWQRRLGPHRAMRVGLAWSGSPVPANRTIALAELRRGLTPAVEFVSLQKHVDASDQAALEASDLRHFGDDIGDFAETAALVSCMDLVITVDTAMAHLAGGLGKSVWVLLPFIPDWRWRVHGSDSPWYPSARLFRQSALGDWRDPIGEVNRCLCDLSKENR